MRDLGIEKSSKILRIFLVQVFIFPKQNFVYDNATPDFMDCEKSKVWYNARSIIRVSHLGPVCCSSATFVRASSRWKKLQAPFLFEHAPTKRSYTHWLAMSSR